MMDENAIYVILGTELQDKVHYGMPVKDGLYDMLDIPSEEMKRFIPNYWINLISPADMDEDEFEKFHTELGFAMKLLKHQSDNAVEMIRQEKHRKVSSETAYFLNSAMKLNLEYEIEPGGVDMCKAMEKNNQRQKIEGVIQGMQLMGASESDIISKIVETFHVTREYVLALLAPKQA